MCKDTALWGSRQWKFKVEVLFVEYLVCEVTSNARASQKSPQDGGCDTHNRQMDLRWNMDQRVVLNSDVF